VLVPFQFVTALDEFGVAPGSNHVALVFEEWEEMSHLHGFILVMPE